MLVLCREPHRQDVGLDVVRSEYDTRLDRRRDQPRHDDAYAHHCVGVFEYGVDVALGVVPAQQHVVRSRVVQRLRVLGVARIDDRAELLDVDQHVLSSVRRELRRLGDDERDRLPDVANAIRREHGMHRRHDLRAGGRGEWKRIDEAVDVGGREHRAHARQRPRGVRVDGDDATVRVHAPHERGVQELRQLQVAGVLRLACDEAPVLGTR